MTEDLKPDAKPMNEDEFLSVLEEQYTFNLKTLKHHYKPFKKKYKNEYYAQKCFESVVNGAMINAWNIGREIDKFFMENDSSKFQQQPFCFQGNITEQDKEGNWHAEIYITVYDWDNPGVSMQDTVAMNTKKKTRNEALQMMKKYVSYFAKEVMEKYGYGGKLIDRKTGKIYE